MVIRAEEKKWMGFEYRLTGNVLYVNDSRIVYAEYLPKDDMTLIHLSVSNEILSCAGDIGDALKMAEEDR